MHQLLLAGLLSVGFVADQSNLAGEAPILVIAPIQTQTQRLLWWSNADYIVFVNPELLLVDGRVNWKLWDEIPVVLRERLSSPSFGGDAPTLSLMFVVAPVGPFNEFDRRDAEIQEHARRAAVVAGFKPAGAARLPGLFEQVSALPESEFLELQTESALDSDQISETPVHLGDIEIFPVETTLARLAPVEVDYIVRLDRPLEEMGGRLDINDIRRIQVFLKANEAKPKPRVQLRLRSNAILDQEERQALHKILVEQRSEFDAVRIIGESITSD